jgi:hypothetical protein
MFVRNLSELAFDRMSTEGAEERLAIGLGIAAPLIGALTAVTGELPIDAVADQVADRDAMLRGAAKHAVVDFAAADGEPPRAADEQADEQPARADEAGRVPATPTARSTSAG